MKRQKIDMRGKKSIYLVGDTHFPRGSRSKFQQVVNRIKNDSNSYMIGLGDWTEGITHSDPRYSPEEAYNIAKKSESNMNMLNNQWDVFEEDIKPISGQVLGLHSGNHGSNVTRRYNSNFLESLCKRNDIFYIGEETCIWNFVSNSNRLLFQTFHGVGGGTTPGYAVSQVDKKSRIVKDVDVIAMGHTHKLAVNVSINPLTVDDDGIKQNIQYQCNCGSFLPNYVEDEPSYGESKMYPPLPMGYVRVDITDCVIDRVIPVPL